MTENLYEGKFEDIPLKIPHELQYRYGKGRGSDDDRLDLIFHHQKNFDLLERKAETEIINKSTKIAERFYIMGLEAYSYRGPHHLSSASELFTRCIAFAPIGTEELWLGYANRSAILLESRLYKEALADIERAFQAGCSEKIHARLYVRKAMCFRAMKPKVKGASQEALRMAKECLDKMDPNDRNTMKSMDMFEEYSQPHKSFGKGRKRGNDKQNLMKLGSKNSEIIGASDAIEIKYKKGQGQYIVASRDIEAGEVFFSGKPYVAALVRSRRYLCCWHCMQQCWACIPCNYCSHAVFCSEKCRHEALIEYHDYECPLLGSILGPNFNPADVLGVKIFLKAFRNAGSFLNLRMQVEDLKSPKNTGPRQKGFTGDVFDGNQYGSVHSMRGVFIKSNEHLYSMDMLVVYLLILFATRTNLFGERLSIDEMCDHEWSNFAGCLLLKHIMIARLNSFSIIDVENHKDEKMIKLRNLSMQRNTAILPMYSLIRCSCNANVCENSFGNIITLFTNSHIKKGEELFLCWAYQYDLAPREQRQADHLSIFGEPCKCIPCKKNWPSGDDIPTYNQKGLPESTVQMLHLKVLFESAEFERIVYEGNLEKVSKTMDDVKRALKILQDNVSPPCRELIFLQTTLMNCRRLLGSRHYSLDDGLLDYLEDRVPSTFLEFDSEEEREALNELHEGSDDGTEV